MKKNFIKKHYHLLFVKNVELVLITLFLISELLMLNQQYIFYAISIFFCLIIAFKNIFYFIFVSLIILLNLFYLFVYLNYIKLHLFQVYKETSSYYLLKFINCVVRINKSDLNQNLSLGEFIWIGDYNFKPENMLPEFDLYYKEEGVIGSITPNNISFFYRGTQYFFWQVLKMYNNDLIKFTFFNDKNYFLIKDNLNSISSAYIFKVNIFKLLILDFVYQKICKFLKLNSKQRKWIQILCLILICYYSLFNKNTIIYLMYKIHFMIKQKIEFKNTKILKSNFGIHLFYPYFLITYTFFYSILGYFIFTTSKNKIHFKWLWIILLSIILFSPIQIYSNYKWHIFDWFYYMFLNQYSLFVWILSMIQLILPIDISRPVLLLTNSITHLMCIIDICIFIKWISLPIVIIYYLLFFTIYWALKK
ncbi:hypothetical protein [Spiroplasma endosymbiont of Crioceris asparagi]|uniref:hypothetical protein n=1 Tax=Spiroplasma endosymbiont of Crioceris asparagi TaxID=3066286 RepID=UPI0030D5C9A2